MNVLESHTRLACNRAVTKKLFQLLTRSISCLLIMSVCSVAGAQSDLVNVQLRDNIIPLSLEIQGCERIDAYTGANLYLLQCDRALKEGDTVDVNVDGQRVSVVMTANPTLVQSFQSPSPLVAIVAQGNQSAGIALKVNLPPELAGMLLIEGQAVEVTDGRSGGTESAVLAPPPLSGRSLDVKLGRLACRPVHDAQTSELNFPCRQFSIEAGPGWFNPHQTDSETTVCAVNKDRSALQCMISREVNDLKIALDGALWRQVEFRPEPDISKYELDLASVIPISPPPMQKLEGNGAGCELPQATYDFLGYCLRNECYPSPFSPTLGGSGAVLPSLEIAGWLRTRSLPTGLNIQVRSADRSVPAEQQTLELAERISWPGLSARPHRFKLKIDFEAGLGGDTASSLKFFSDSQCQVAADQSPIAYAVGHEQTISTSQACLFGQVFNTDDSVSSTCEQIVLNRQEEHANLKVDSLNYGSERFVVLVSRSSGLSSFGRRMKEALTAWIDDSRQEWLSRRVPITIATVNETGNVETAIRAEDLETTNAQQINSMATSVGAFGQQPQRPLRDLQNFFKSYDGRIGKVLFIVGDTPGEGREVSRADVAGPLVWSLFGIPFWVATVGTQEQCVFWRDKARASRCVVMERNMSTEDLLDLLRGFDGIDPGEGN